MIHITLQEQDNTFVFTLHKIHLTSYPQLQQLNFKKITAVGLNVPELVTSAEKQKLILNNDVLRYFLDLNIHREHLP